MQDQPAHTWVNKVNQCAATRWGGCSAAILTVLVSGRSALQGRVWSSSFRRVNLVSPWAGPMWRCCKAGCSGCLRQIDGTELRGAVISRVVGRIHLKSNGGAWRCARPGLKSGGRPSCHCQLQHTTPEACSYPRSLQPPPGMSGQTGSARLSFSFQSIQTRAALD